MQDIHLCNRLCASFLSLTTLLLKAIAILYALKDQNINVPKEESLCEIFLINYINYSVIRDIVLNVSRIPV